jgi:hypothetical protein
MIFPDGKSGRLRCRGLRAGYVHELDVAALRSRAGVCGSASESLLHGEPDSDGVTDVRAGMLPWF